MVKTLADLQNGARCPEPKKKLGDLSPEHGITKNPNSPSACAYEMYRLCSAGGRAKEMWHAFLELREINDADSRELLRQFFGLLEMDRTAKQLFMEAGGIDMENFERTLSALKKYSGKKMGEGF